MTNNVQDGVNLKQRIIGAIVLVSLGIIFIPMLLNSGSGSHNEIYSSNIPPIPDSLNQQLPAIKPMEPTPSPVAVKAVPVEHKPVTERAGKTIKPKEQIIMLQQVNKDNIKQITSKIGINKTVKPAKVAPAEKFKPAMKPKTKKITQAYTLQIASFSNRKNAFALRDKLRKKDFKAYIESVTTAKGKIYRLRVGPYLKYEQLAGIQKKIEQQFRLKKTIIVNYKT